MRNARKRRLKRRTHVIKVKRPWATIKGGNTAQEKDYEREQQRSAELARRGASNW